MIGTKYVRDGRAISTYQVSVLALTVLLVVVLVAIHSPGQISVDSGIALYEGAVGRAVGWGPTFFAAVLSWLGGRALGSSIFVALNTLATFSVFAALMLAGARLEKGRYWRIGLAAVLALNPLFLFYVGIVWKDVMLATAAAVSVVLLLSSTLLSRRGALFSLCLAAAVISVLPLLRQQGILLAAPLGVACAWLVGLHFAASDKVHRGAFAATLATIVFFSLFFSSAAASTVKKLPASPTSVGLLTIRAYDIIGMVAYAKSSDASAWTGASPTAIARMKEGYSPERIDSVWHDPEVRGFINGLSAEQSEQRWIEGIRHDPTAYLTHRVAAFRSLLGLSSIKGCVPAYWGVAAVPEHLSALGLNEEMDPRDRFLGANVISLENSFVFRHWWYVLLLVAATIASLCARRSMSTWIIRATIVAAWMYLGCFLPTSIACDFRYLYPVALLATIACMALLVQAGSGCGSKNLGAEEAK